MSASPFCPRTNLHLHPSKGGEWAMSYALVDDPERGVLPLAVSSRGLWDFGLLLGEGAWTALGALAVVAA